jgi:uncharacterized protein YecT (DUF1311 family)
MTKQDSIKIESEVKLAAQKVKGTFANRNKGEEYLTDLRTEFALDTFKIEERRRLKLEIDYSTTGMVTSTLDANREYDQLLNKYLKRLLESLQASDREILRQSQRNWVKYRDSELELNRLLMDENYSGGGTIQRMLAAARALELTQDRVVDIFHYLSRKAE